MGEIGIPYDMDNKHAYKTGDYDGQITAMDANMCALESSLLNFTLWNYCPVNSFKWGDGWNGEDLSIFSYDEMKRLAENGVGGGVDKMLAAGKADETSSRTSEDTCSSERKAHIMSSLGKESSLDPANDAMINSGGRALKAFVRPYPLATPGSPTVLKFDMRGKYMVFTYECALSSSATSSSWGPNTTITTAVATPQMNTSNTKKSQVPPFSEQLDQWCELYLPRIYFPRDADVETFTCHGPATALKFQNTGDWIISTEHQRAWYKCPCTMQASGMIFTPNLESSKQQQQQEPSTSARRSVTVDPSCRHTIVIRCKNNDDNSSGNEKSMEDFAKEVVGGVSAGEAGLGFNRCCPCL